MKHKHTSMVGSGWNVEPSNQLDTKVEQLVIGWGRKWLEPATGSRGQGGLPITGTVVDWSQTFTKEGWGHAQKELTQSILALIEEARTKTVADVLNYLDTHQNLDKYEIEGVGVPIGGRNYYNVAALIKHAQKAQLKANGAGNE